MRLRRRTRTLPAQVNTVSTWNEQGAADDGLDPEIRRFVKLMSQRWRMHPALDKVSFPEARRIAEEVRSAWTRGGP